MIGYLEGKILKKEAEKILLLVNHIGYEVIVPDIVNRDISAKGVGDEIALYIYHQQSERQPKPVLIGFTKEAEKDFFQSFISVEDIGPLKAVKAMGMNAAKIAAFIENKDVAGLKKLKGVGERTAKKIIATLSGKMARFIIPSPAKEQPDMQVEFAAPVLDVLINRLGFKPAQADKMIKDTLRRKSFISAPEELFDEIFKGVKE